MKPLNKIFFSSKKTKTLPTLAIPTTTTTTTLSNNNNKKHFHTTTLHFSTKHKVTNHLLLQKLSSLNNNSLKPNAKSLNVTKKKELNEEENDENLLENKNLLSELDHLLLENKPILSTSDKLKNDLFLYFNKKNKDLAGKVVVDGESNGESNGMAGSEENNEMAGEMVLAGKDFKKEYFSQEEKMEIFNLYRNCIFFGRESNPEKFYFNYNILVFDHKDHLDHYYIGHNFLKLILMKVLKLKENNYFEMEEYLLNYFLNSNELYYIYFKNNCNEFENYFKNYLQEDLINKKIYERYFKAILGNVGLNHLPSLLNFILFEFIPKFKNLLELNLNKISTKRAFQKDLNNPVELFEYYFMRQYKQLPTYISNGSVNNMNDMVMIQIYDSNYQLLSIGYGKDIQTAKEDGARRAMVHFA
ncbi:hypothetical protein ABK040_012797 [Willaertia magna]